MTRRLAIAILAALGNALIVTALAIAAFHSAHHPYATGGAALIALSGLILLALALLLHRTRSRP